MSKKEIRAELKKAGLKPADLGGCCLLGFCGAERKRLAKLSELLSKTKKAA